MPLQKPEPNLRNQDVPLLPGNSGMGHFSASKSNVPEVADYIRRQEEHHHQFNYKQEFLALLRKHGVEYDERYVWD